MSKTRRSAVGERAAAGGGGLLHSKFPAVHASSIGDVEGAVIGAGQDAGGQRLRGIDGG